MVIRDPFELAIVELDDADLKALHDVYRNLWYESDSIGRKAFFAAVGAHLDTERCRRDRVLGEWATELMNPDGEAGELVADGDMDRVIREAAQELRDGH